MPHPLVTAISPGPGGRASVHRARPGAESPSRGGSGITTRMASSRPAQKLPPVACRPQEYRGGVVRRSGREREDLRGARRCRGARPAHHHGVPRACHARCPVAHGRRAARHRRRSGVPRAGQPRQAPAGHRGLVIVDESHHFRNPRTRRFGFIAPWLVGRPVLLVSATPVVNRMADLVHQLRLGVRDDALSADGIASLHRALMAGRSYGAVADRGRGVRREGSPARSSGRRQPCRRVRVHGSPSRHRAPRPPDTLAALRPRQCWCAESCSARQDRAPLRCSVRCGVTAPCSCTRGTPWRRDSRSPEPKSVDSRESSRSSSYSGRSSGARQAAHDLEPADLDVLETVIDETAGTVTAPDPKLARLDALLSDGRPTLVFVSNRDTVRHLRDRLGTGVDRRGARGSVPVSARAPCRAQWSWDGFEPTRRIPVPVAPGAATPDRHRRGGRRTRSPARRARHPLRPAVDANAARATRGPRGTSRLRTQ